jgi:hypothetical protein
MPIPNRAPATAAEGPLLELLHLLAQQNIRSGVEHTREGATQLGCNQSILPSHIPEGHRHETRTAVDSVWAYQAEANPGVIDVMIVGRPNVWEPGTVARAAIGNTRNEQEAWTCG